MMICKHETHGGECQKTGTYCNMSPCPYEELIEVAEIVRCKDCHYHDAEYGYCCWWENDVGDNDFCSFAKKDGAEE